jgi:teichuronic acid exporter
MSDKQLKKDLKSGALWTSGGQFIITLINLVANILLARFLSPDDFGVMGIIMFFVLIGNILGKGGLSGALVRMNNVTKKDYSTTFIFNLSVSVCLYILLVICSEFIANFYNRPEIRILLIVVGLTFVINAFQLVTITHLIRTFKFKERFLYQFGATILSVILSIGLAYNGFGIWSLVVLPLSNSIFLTIILFYFHGFYGGVIFSKDSFNNIYKFGVNTSLANLLNVGFENVYSLVLGSYFSITQVGFYYQANKLQKVPNNVINSFAQRVLFPVLAQKQEDLTKFNEIYTKVLTFFTVIVGLVGLLVFIYAEIGIDLLLGEKWFGAVFYLKLLIVASFFYMQEQFNRVIFKVFDQTKQILILELIKKAFQSLTIIIGIYYANLEFLMYGFVVTNVFSFFVNYVKSRKITKTFSLIEIFMILKVIICCSLTVILIQYLFKFFSLTTYNSLLMIPLIIFIYLTLIFSVKVVTIMDIKGLVKNKIA